MMKKRMSAISILLLLCVSLLFTSCGQSAAPGNDAGASSGSQAVASQASSDSAATAAGGGQETVIKLVCSTGGSGKSLAGSVESFNKAFAGKIKVETDMIAQESLLETMMLQFISGAATYDLLSTLWIPATRPSMAPLNDYLKRDGIDVDALYGAGVMADSIQDGTYRCIPYRSQCFPIFYRTDLFKEAGLNPPADMKEYLDCARKLTKRNADGSIARYGTSLQMQSPYWTVQTFAVFFMPMGGYFLTEDLKHASPTLTSQLSYDVMNFLKTLQDEGLCPNPLSFTYDDNVVGLQTDQIAFCNESSARSSLMEDPAKSKVVGKFGYATLKETKLGEQPMSNFASIWFLGIDASSKHKDEAWEFVKWATSVEQQEYMAYEYSNGPTVLSIYDDPKYQEFNTSALATKDLLQVMPRDFLPVSRTSELQMVIHEELQNFMLGKQDEKKAGKNMYDRIEAVMSQG